MRAGHGRWRPAFLTAPGLIGVAGGGGGGGSTGSAPSLALMMALNRRRRAFERRSTHSNDGLP